MSPNSTPPICKYRGSYLYIILISNKIFDIDTFSYGKISIYIASLKTLR